MRTKKRILALGLSLFSALAGGTVAEETMTLARTQVVRETKHPEEGTVPTFFPADDYENLVDGTFIKQEGKTITTKFGGLSYKKKYNFVFIFGGAAISSSNQLDAKFRIDTGNGYWDIAELTLKTPPTTAVKDSSGNLEARYEDGELGFIYTCPKEMGGALTITLTLGSTNTYLSRVSVYKGESYRGYIEFKCDFDDTTPRYSVGPDGKVDIVASPDKPILPGDLLEGLIAYDEYDKRWIRPQPEGDSLEQYAGKVAKGFKVGDTATVRFLATDFALNTTYITVVIHYQDLVAPTITVNGLEGNKTLPIPYSEAKTEAEAEGVVIAHTQVADDIRAGISPSVKIDGFAPYKMGTFPVTVTAFDGYNTTEWTGSVRIYDDVAPQIIGPSSLTTAVNTPITTEGLIDMFTVTDEIDGDDVSVSLENDEYHASNNAVRQGTYSVTLVAYDSSGNRAEKTFQVKVEDREGPVWYVYGTTLTVMEGSSLTPMQIVEQLVAESSIENLDYVKADIISGSPIDGTNEVGSYKLVIRAETRDGATRYAGLTLDVVPKDRIGLDSNPPKAHSSFVQFFIDLWNSIVSFFKKLFGIA